jgi:SPP1 family predicted phage head-tail adaptor
MNELIKLIAVAETTDGYGDQTTSETSVDRLAEIKSIGQSEFYQANASGLKPEIKFVLADFFDYDGQKVIEYGGVRYRVLRTFQVGKTLEITCYTAVND